MKRSLVLLAVTFALGAFSQDTIRVKTEFNYEAFLKWQSTKYSGKKFSEFEIEMSKKSKFSNADLVNKITFVNFWFESCPPCIAEIEGFNEMFANLKDNPNFTFVSFTFEPESAIREFIKKYNIKYKIIQIEKAECYRLNFNNGFPSSFILDKEGIVRYYKGGGPIDKVKATKAVLTEIYPKILELL